VNWSLCPSVHLLSVCAQLDPARGPTQGVSWLHSIVPGAKKIVFSGDTGQFSSLRVIFYDRSLDKKNIFRLQGTAFGVYL